MACNLVKVELSVVLLGCMLSTKAFVVRAYICCLALLQQKRSFSNVFNRLIIRLVFVVYLGSWLLEYISNFLWIMIYEIEISQTIFRRYNLIKRCCKDASKISLIFIWISWMKLQFHFFEILMQTMEFDFCFTCIQVFHMHLFLIYKRHVWYSQT